MKSFNSFFIIILLIFSTGCTPDGESVECENQNQCDIALGEACLNYQCESLSGYDNASIGISMNVDSSIITSLKSIEVIAYNSKTVKKSSLTCTDFSSDSIHEKSNSLRRALLKNTPENSANVQLTLPRVPIVNGVILTIKGYSGKLAMEKPTGNLIGYVCLDGIKLTPDVLAQAPVILNEI